MVSGSPGAPKSGRARARALVQADIAIAAVAAVAAVAAAAAAVQVAAIDAQWLPSQLHAVERKRPLDSLGVAKLDLPDGLVTMEQLHADHQTDTREELEDVDFTQLTNAVHPHGQDLHITRSTTFKCSLRGCLLVARCVLRGCLLVARCVGSGTLRRRRTVTRPS